MSCALGAMTGRVYCKAWRVPAPAAAAVVLARLRRALGALPPARERARSLTAGSAARRYLLARLLTYGRCGRRLESIARTDT